MLETVRHGHPSVRIPVAVKLSPFHTSPVQFALALERAGAAGVVLFNRFYQPDFNIEELEVEPQLILSDSAELLLRLRWLAIISPQIKGSLAATGGVHTADGRGQGAPGRAPTPSSSSRSCSSTVPASWRRCSTACATGWGSTATRDRRVSRRHEPQPLPGSLRLRAGQLPADSAELAGLRDLALRPLFGVAAASGAPWGPAAAARGFLHTEGCRRFLGYEERPRNPGIERCEGRSVGPGQFEEVAVGEVARPSSRAREPLDPDGVAQAFEWDRARPLAERERFPGGPAVGLAAGLRAAPDEADLRSRTGGQGPGLRANPMDPKRTRFRGHGGNGRGQECADVEEAHGIGSCWRIRSLVTGGAPTVPACGIRTIWLPWIRHSNAVPGRRPRRLRPACGSTTWPLLESTVVMSYRLT